MSSFGTYHRLAILDNTRTGINLDTFETMGELLESCMYRYCAGNDPIETANELCEMAQKVKAQIVKDYGETPKPIPTAAPGEGT